MFKIRGIQLLSSHGSFMCTQYFIEKIGTINGYNMAYVSVKIIVTWVGTRNKTTNSHECVALSFP